MAYRAFRERSTARFWAFGWAINTSRAPAGWGWWSRGRPGS